MEYVVAFQLLCGCFAGFVAARKRRNWAAWFAAGTLLPVAGVVLSCRLRARPPAGEGTPRRRRRREPLRRCTGQYAPDCQGCSWFRRPLFDSSYADSKKGYCERFTRPLYEQDRCGERAGEEPQ